MKKNTSLLFLTLCFSYLLMASKHTDEDWKTSLNTEGLPQEDQAYCYTDEAGAINGDHVGRKIRLASVSKLITSL